MSRALVAVLAFTTLAGVACAHAEHPPAASAAAAPTQPGATASDHGMAGVCPMNVPGTQVSAEDTVTGEAVTFSTTPDQADALRDRVHALAAMHNRYHLGAAGGGTDHGMAGMDQGRAGMDHATGGMGGMDHGMTGGMGGGMAEGHMAAGAHAPPARADVEDTPTGARLLLTPVDPADVGVLRSTVRMHAEQMQQHGCAMMEGPGGSMR